MKTRLFCSLALLFSLCARGSAGDALEKGFIQPPPEARPWVYWFWLNGNISSNGITADLEAMKRVGIGGVLIMETDQGMPVGPVDFMGTQWRALFQHVVAEAHRLGLAVNMNDDAGWNGSGGPWIKPEQSMQKAVWSETNLTGPAHFEGTLRQPETVAGFYRDINVVAFPTTGSHRIDRIRAKAMYEIGHIGGIAQDQLPPEMIIPRERLVTLTPQMDGTGRLVWEVPDGQWTVLRFGHTSTGAENAPAPKTGRGLECDKLSPQGIEANFAGMMAKLATDNGLAPGSPGTTGLVATHIDSWENGSQNWTSRMREEFRQRRGYDLFPFLPVLTGRVVDSLEISERFLWDLRRTVSELVVENYAGHFRELAHAHGMRFTVEAYGSPCDSLAYGGQSDEPMGEFWSPSGAMETCKGMAGAGHIYGKRIIGAEAFTADDHERWREYPGSLKALGDRAFCEGINRFVFHRYALQPWAGDYRPGMMMGPWGQHYERTETWWELTPPWHEYLARCQFLLRQGLFVADICYLQAETPPQGFGEHPRQGYDWDECGSEAVLSRMAVKDGRIVLLDGMSYRVLALSRNPRMTPRLLRKIKELVQAGATVVGAPPQKSPSLSGYPQCDAEVKELATLWGDCDGKQITQHKFGLGRVLWSDNPAAVLRQLGVPPDFVSGQPLRHIHRVDGDTDFYFVANPNPHALTTTGTFRVAGKVPELWWPDSGRIERAPLWQSKDNRTSVVLSLEASGSVFVVFRERTAETGSYATLKRDGKPLLSALPEPPVRVVVERATYGVPDDPQRTRDVREKVQGKIDAGEPSFPASAMAEGDDPAPNVVKTLTVDYTLDGRSYSVKAEDPMTIHLTGDALKLTIEKARYGVLDDPKRTRDVRRKLQRLVDAGESSFPVSRMAAGDDPAYLVVKTLEVEYSRNGEHLTARGTDPEVIDLNQTASGESEAVLEFHGVARGRASFTVFKRGRYELQTADGQHEEFSVADLPQPLALTGSWQVHFASDSGAPPEITLANLSSWSTNPDPGVKFFSGSATYGTVVKLPRDWLTRERRVFLDLGRVGVMAEVMLNGHNLGLLWKAPYRLDVTEAAKAGNNKLEIRVTNLWPNRMIGDEQLPEDSERNPNGTLKAWPEWLLEGKPSPSGRYTFAGWRLWKKSDALLDSGLLGPVRLIPAEDIPVHVHP
jgi:hypothetical protein